MKKLLMIIAPLLPMGGGLATLLNFQGDPVFTSLGAFLTAIGGGIAGVMILITTGGKFLGALVSFIGAHYYGAKWETDYEPKIVEGLKATITGLKSHG